MQRAVAVSAAVLMGACGPRILGGVDDGQSSSGGSSGATSTAGRGGNAPSGSGGSGASSGAGDAGSSNRPGAGGSAGTAGTSDCVKCQWSTVGQEEGILPNINREHDLAVSADGTVYATGRWDDVAPIQGQTTAWILTRSSANSGFAQDAVHLSAYPSLTIASNGAVFTTLGHNVVRRLMSDAWVDVGHLNPSYEETPASIVTDSGGVPHIVHSQNQFSTVMRWKEPAWVEVGSPREQPYRRVALAIDGQDTLYSVYKDVSLGTLSVEKLPLPELADGVNWKLVGEAGFRALAVATDRVSFAVSRSGTPYFAFLSADNSKVLVWTFDGNSWKQLGEPLGMDGVLQGADLRRVLPSIAVAPDGVPFVTYRGIAPKDGIEAMLLAYWNGSAWTLHDSRGFTNSQVIFVKLAIRSDGMKYVGFNNSNQPSLIVRRFD
jgi:hypothetical protein